MFLAYFHDNIVNHNYCDQDNHEKRSYNLMHSRSNVSTTFLKFASLFLIKQKCHKIAGSCLSNMNTCFFCFFGQTKKKPEGNIWDTKINDTLTRSSTKKIVNGP